MGPVTLRVVSWNVLADTYAHADLYPGAEPALLESGARASLVADTLERLDADVVCLQEVERGLLDAWVSDGRLQDYDLHYLRRPGRPDGCATLVRALRARASRALVYPGCEEVAQVLVLTGGPLSLTVANTHLRWSPDGSTATRQLGHLLADLAPEPRAVLCADANVGPTDPARAALRAHALHDLAGAASTAVVDGEPRPLDLVAVRGLAGLLARPLAPRGPLPSRLCPSDHVPLVATVAVV